MASQDAVLRKIRAMLDRANHPGTPQEEIDTCLEMADKWMTEHAIEQAQLDALRPADERVKPEILRLVVCERGNPLWRQLVDLAGYLATYCRCKEVYYGLQSNGRYGIDIKLVGFPADLRYFEMLFTSLVLQMTSNLEPKPDLTKSLAENVYILHEAGVKWRRMADVLNKTNGTWDAHNGFQANPAVEHWRKEVRPSKTDPDMLIPWPDGHRLINLYRRWCREIGELPRAIQSPIAYQRNFAEGFAGRVSMRLWEMEHRKQGTGTALALRTEAVKEMYDEHFGELKEDKRKRPELRTDIDAWYAGCKAGDQADIGLTRVKDANRPQLT